MPIQILLLTGMLAALDPPPVASQAPAAPHRHAGRPFISPMGEPFPVHGQGDDTLIDWFQQADSNRDGSLSLTEMQRDADRFFALLDTNHDGEIDPDEVTHYEQVIAPNGIGFGTRLAAADGDESSPERRHGGDGRGGGHRGGRGHGGWAGGESDNMGQGRSRFGLLDLPEPVAAADTDLSRGISRDEFRTAAQLRFQALDVTHQGRLTLDVLESLLRPPPVRPKKDPDAPSDLDANTDTGG
jgi:Ca2+-binding EF-hand superfamily protein